MSAAVLLPTGFVGFGAERLFLAVADGLDAIAANSALNERVLDCIRTVGSQCQVVFGGTTLVTVPFDHDVNVRMLLQELCVGLQWRLLIGADVRLVVFEVNIFHALSEELLPGAGRSRLR